MAKARQEDYFIVILQSSRHKDRIHKISCSTFDRYDYYLRDKTNLGQSKATRHYFASTMLDKVSEKYLIKHLKDSDLCTVIPYCAQCLPDERQKWIEKYGCNKKEKQ